MGKAPREYRGAGKRIGTKLRRATGLDGVPGKPGRIVMSDKKPYELFIGGIRAQRVFIYGPIKEV